MRGVFEDLAGKVFGSIKVIKRADNETYANGDVKVVWLVKCMRCEGKPYLVRGNNLKTGTSTQCSSCRNKDTKEKNQESLFGKTFGRLTVIGDLPERKNGRNHWVTSCSCGTSNFLVSAASLKRGATKSCGCLTESFIASETKRYFLEKYKAIAEYPLIRSPRGRMTKCDIYIPDGIFVEIHGKQHYQNDAHFYKSDEEYNYRRKVDRIKKRFASSVGLYIEVDLRKIKTPEESIVLIESILKTNGRI